MNLYYVNYKPGYLLGSSQYFGDDAVYIFDSKYATTRSVYVNSKKNNKEFALHLQNACNKGWIDKYTFTKHEDTHGITHGRFDKTEVDNLTFLKAKASIQKVGLKLGKEVSNKSKTLQDLENSFSNIVGLDNVKNDIKDLYCFIKVSKERQKRGFKDDPISLHTVFKGAPGTGKTTMARHIGKLYKELGVLKKGHVVEVDRSGLVDAFIGHTEVKTKKKLNEALDGILFIDEAYALGQSTKDDKDYGKHAIEVILKFMEDNRDRIAIFVAGYDKKMDDFFASNPGLKSRFTNHYDFDSYNHNELVEIFDIIMKDKFEYNGMVKKELSKYFKKLIEMTDAEFFGNGREVRNTCEYLRRIQHARIYNLENYEDREDSYFKKIKVNDIKKLSEKKGILKKKIYKS